ncbi:spore coat protein U domain-containing protein [Aliidiomarina indica]|uniref:spore coat protein U domain-containing protein n=1 Tax=Aliidiomarina indica TaxID=2749147 RepID=UPI00188DCF5C|nr:spore coat protein U domain-containing protein [Aliidiomarina indica]
MNTKLTILAILSVTASLSSAAMAETASGTMNVSATVAEACSVSASTMTFPPLSPFVQEDVVADTAGSLMIACTSVTTPLIWSDSPRFLTGPGAGVDTIPFSLGQTPATALTNALPVISSGEAIAAPFTADGTEQAVPLHGLIKAADYSGKAPGLYSASIVINVEY